MSFKVFISHSVNPRELAIVYSLAEEAAKQAITPFIPDRDWEPRQGMPGRILQPIQECDAMVVVGTKFGSFPGFISAEVNALDGGKPVLCVLDSGVDLSATQPVQKLIIDRLDLPGTILQASQVLKSLQVAKAGKDALTWLVVGGLLFMLFQEKQ